ncbi:unnamed protein product [Mytilus edulis]|uniref:Uncharacterized protein n=1 Tax=Mytilus edulis TaxID=6550 RepID=A0A8S3PYQ6_MYTED|nr:unnamed protein product [Mytilus edulis]
MGILSAQRYAALELIQKLVHSSSEEDYNANLKLIETTCPRQIFNWHNIHTEWVLVLTYFERSLTNTTNNRIESFNQKLKQVIKLYSGLDLFFENFIPLIGTLRNERYCKENQKYKKAFFVAQKLAAACSAVGMKKFMSRMKLWKNNHTVEVENSCTTSTTKAEQVFALDIDKQVPVYIDEVNAVLNDN